MTDKTTFVKALRPFSLIVAIATCGLGVSLALIEGIENFGLVWLVMITGVLLQVAVNLTNDYQDINNKQFTEVQLQAINRNTKIGWMIMLLAIILGLYMVSIRGWPLLLLGIVGIFGAWGYTGGQINYKNRGLGVLLVFLFMGVLLIGGSYYVIAGTYHWNIFWLSIPFSLLSSLLLLSNELRDYETDLADGIKTLSVRLGYSIGVKLYYWLVVLTYMVSVLLYQANILHGIILILITMLVLWQPLKLLNTAKKQRYRLTSLTGRFYFIYSVVYIATIWIPLP
ncbi:prenyltransferase [Candidatus Halobeggiatoa sp. HSG11]|nr:prenyltransferase [Candidatus Halobeggiatoa sp. HSG11]